MKRPLLIGGPILVLLLLAGTAVPPHRAVDRRQPRGPPPTRRPGGLHRPPRRFPRRRRPIRCWLAVTYRCVSDLADGGLTPEMQADLQAYVDDVAALDGVPASRACSTRRPGFPPTSTSPVLAMPPDQWPPRRARSTGPCQTGSPATRPRSRSSRSGSCRTRRRAAPWSTRSVTSPTPPGTGRSPAWPRLAVARLHGQLLRIVPVAVAIVIARDRRRPVPDLRIGLPAGQGRPHEPRLDHRQSSGRWSGSSRRATCRGCSGLRGHRNDRGAGCRSSCSRSCSACRWTTRCCSCPGSASGRSRPATTRERSRRGSASPAGSSPERR